MKSSFNSSLVLIQARYSLNGIVLKFIVKQHRLKYRHN